MTEITYSQAEATGVLMPQLSALWKVSFPEDSPFFVDWLFRECAREQLLYTACRGDKLAAMLFARPISLCAGADTIPTAYIQGVATDPLFRKQGICRHLIKYSLTKLPSANLPLAVLKPFSPHFYRHLGFGDAFYLRNLSLPQIGRANYMQEDNSFCVNVGNKVPPAQFSAIYNVWIKNFGFYVRRSEEEWGKLLTDHHADGGEEVVLYDLTGKIRAYSLCFFSPASLKVREIAYLDIPAARRLISFLLHHRDKARQITLTLPESDESRLLFPDENDGSIHAPFIMARIVDIPAAFNCRTFATDGEISLQIGTHGPLYNLRVQNGQTKAALINETAPDRLNHAARIDIAALSRLYLGLTSAQALASAERLICSPEQLALLKVWFPRQSAYFQELF